MFSLHRLLLVSDKIEMDGQSLQEGVVLEEKVLNRRKMANHISVSE